MPKSLIYKVFIYVTGVPFLAFVDLSKNKNLKRPKYLIYKGNKNLQIYEKVYQSDPVGSQCDSSRAVQFWTPWGLAVIVVHVKSLDPVGSHRDSSQVVH